MHLSFQHDKDSLSLRFGRGYFALRCALTAALLLSVVSNLYEYAVSPGSQSPHETRASPLLFFAESLFAAWLVIGKYPACSWVLAVIVFSGFGVLSATKVFAGDSSCGCFGQTTTPPAWTLTFDTAAVTGLLWYCPFCTGIAVVSRARRALVAIGVAATCVSAIAGATGWQPEHSSIAAQFGQVRMIKACGLSCIADVNGTAEVFLGIPPSLLDAKNLDESLDSLRSFAADRDSGVSAVSPSVLIADLEAWTAFPVIFTDEEKHLYVLLARHQIKNRSLYRVLHGSIPPQDLTVDELKAIRIVEAWATASRALPVGDGRLFIPERWRDLGITVPRTDNSVTFEMQNVGKSALQVKVDRTSCGCLAATISPTVIPPGEKALAEVRFRTGAGASFRHSLWLQVSDSATSAVQSVEFRVFGRQPETMIVSADTIDFGTLGHGDESFRSIRISETAQDRFAIHEIRTKAPIQHSIAETADEAGLRSYLLTLSLDVSRVGMSGINDDLYIRTSSRFIPELRIPIHAVRQSTVSLQPPRLAFGSVYIGDSRRMSILTSCASGRIHRLTLIEKPPGTEVHISEDPDEPVIIDISFDSDKTGAWNGLFRFSAMSDMGREIIELPAVAYVRNR